MPMEAGELGMPMEAGELEQQQTPLTGDELSTFIPPTPRQVLRICLNLKHLIDNLIPIQFDKQLVVAPDSKVISKRVLRLALEAAGGKGNGKKGSSSRKYRAVLVFALLKVTGWYWELSATELHDSELFLLRAEVAQHIAKSIIEQESDPNYLFIQVLCRRYSVNLNAIDSEPQSALELAVDMHSTTVIGSSGYQRCVKWLWRGWIVQSAVDPSSYVLYKKIARPSLTSHFDPERVKTPLYQNFIEIFFSVMYLVLYTLVINKTEKGVTPLSVFEIGYFFFTISYVYDELIKLYHVGYNYLSFWSVFNDVLYAIVITSIVLRVLSLTKPHGSSSSVKFDLTSFRILSLAAPLMWCRLLLYLDAQRFVGAMIVVIKLMMKESIIFFFLLAVVILGFLQGFIGIDNADGKRDATTLIVTNLARTILGSGDFDAFERFVPPYADILYYFYSFLVSVILLNVLVALYASAYNKIYDNALDEYMALVAGKTLRYIRAPDVSVYVPPLNLVELVISPLELFFPKKIYASLNYYLMLILYSPFLVYISIKETRESRRVKYNRFKGLPDDANEYDREWDLSDGYEESYDGIFSTDGTTLSMARNTEDLTNQLAAERSDPNFNVEKSWYKKVQEFAPQIDKGDQVGLSWELYPLYDKVEKLTKLVETIANENKELRERIQNQSSQ